MSTIAYIETFSAVVENGSFTAAADALGISKPVVSKQVSLLEQQLGVQLLQRTTRRLHLTEAGEVFASYAKRIMSEVREAEQSVLPLQSEPQGRLRISVPESLAISILPDLLLSLQTQYPGLELDIQVTGRFIDLVEEGVDVALRVGNLKDSSLVARKIMPCSFHICGSPKYFEKYGIPSHPSELEAHNCLIYSQIQKSDNWSFKDETGKTFNIRVKGNLSSEAGNLLMNAALNGNGLFIGPSYMVDSAIQEGRLRTVLDDYAHPATGLYAVYPYSKLVSIKVRGFVDHLVDAWGK